jgi:predicted nucleotidyltransferase
MPLEAFLIKAMPWRLTIAGFGGVKPAGEIWEKGGDHMKRNELIRRIRHAVQEVEPAAEIILFGSRSRGDALSESDWDLLILVDGPLDDKRTDRVRYRLYEIEWETGEVISSIVRNGEEWNSDLYRSMPFYQRVMQEGVRL